VLAIPILQILWGKIENEVMVMGSTTSIELLEDELSAVAQAGEYASKEEVIVHALEVLLAAHPPLRTRTAVELYRLRKITLLRAAEIAGLEIEAFKEQLAHQEVPVQVDESAEEVRSGANSIRRLRGAT
jgi:predicted HTH domain antitoxin